MLRSFQTDMKRVSALMRARDYETALQICRSYLFRSGKLVPVMAGTCHSSAALCSRMTGRLVNAAQHYTEAIEAFQEAGCVDLLPNLEKGRQSCLVGQQEEGAGKQSAGLVGSVKQMEQRAAECLAAAKKLRRGSQRWRAEMAEAEAALDKGQALLSGLTGPLRDRREGALLMVRILAAEQAGDLPLSEQYARRAARWALPPSCPALCRAVDLPLLYHVLGFSLPPSPTCA